MTIQELVQNYVNNRVKQLYKADPCQPHYTVSLLDNTLILTVAHMGSIFSHTLFPEKDMTYGISNIDDIIESLYNRTM